MLDANGQVRTSWQTYFSASQAWQRQNTGTDTTARDTATAAQTAATSAQTDATSALAQLATITSSPSLWTAGDYKQSAQALGTGWLECDGSEFDTATYPGLEAVLSGITAPGATAGTRKLPGIAAVYDDAHPGPGGPAVIRWFVRAV